MHSPSTQVVIVDDQPVFRAAARKLLRMRGYRVVGEADCAAAALDIVARLAPDAALVDVCLGEESGFAAARLLTRAHPGLRVLLVSADDRRVDRRRICECGACGFVLKSELPRVDLARYWRADAGDTTVSCG